MNNEGEIIILNGASCSGKTTLAHEIQTLSHKAYLATGLEHFMPMLSGKYIGVDDSVVQQQAKKADDLDETLQQAMRNWSKPGAILVASGFEIGMEEQKGGTRFTSQCGPVGWNLLAGMHRAFGAMARAGNNLLVADVISEALMYDYCAALKGQKVYLVGLQAPLEELLRREQKRKDIGVGAVAMQFEKVHIPGEYDLIVHTDKQSPQECAQMVIDYVENNSPRAFDKLVESHGNFTVTEFPVRTF